MRRIISILALSIALAAPALAADAPAAPGADDKGKKNANPCRDEVAAALQKLRNSSWFRMETYMITENGPTNMTVDYVLPDRMRQKVSVVGQPNSQEVILIGDKSWGNEGDGWRTLPGDLTTQLIGQMKDNVLSQQDDVGNYSCKGKTTLDGKDVISYKLEDELQQDGSKTQNEAFRMFYVDATTGLPVRNAIVTADRMDKPVFKTVYSFPIDMKIDVPKDVKADAAPAAAAAPEERK